jgi:hypothetical protein
MSEPSVLPTKMSALGFWLPLTPSPRRKQRRLLSGDTAGCQSSAPPETMSVSVPVGVTGDFL